MKGGASTCDVSYSVVCIVLVIVLFQGVHGDSGAHCGHVKGASGGGNRVVKDRKTSKSWNQYIKEDHHGDE